jgi:hypothetical protein
VSPKHTVLSTITSKLVNAAYPDMWLVALVSRTHVPALRSFSSSRCAYNFSLSLIFALEELTSTVDPDVELAFGRVRVFVMRRSDLFSSSYVTCACSFLGFEQNSRAECPILS